MGGALFGERGQQHSCGKGQGAGAPASIFFVEGVPGGCLLTCSSAGLSAGRQAAKQPVSVTANQPRKNFTRKEGLPSTGMAKTHSQCREHRVHPRSGNYNTQAAAKSSHLAHSESCVPH